MHRRNVRWIVALFLGVGLVGHYLYWYAPRERPAAPTPDDLPARLLADPRATFALWLPYPHQNLAAVADVVGDLDRLVATLARRGHGNAVAVPRFGPFLAPPAREIGACWNADGDVVLAARVYPALTVISRLAGKVASNPWLAGGAVELAGRPATVEWQGTLWIARTRGAALPWVGDGVTDAPRNSEKLLGEFRLGADAPPLPLGRYRVRREEDGELAAVLADTVALPSLPARTLAESQTALLVIRGTGFPHWTEPFQRPGAMALSEHGNAGLPRATVFARPDQEPWKLPARGLAELLSGEPEKAEVAGLRLIASDTAALDAGRALAPAVAPWLGAEHGPLVLGLWLDPRAARGALGGASKVLAGLPFLGHRREAEALADWRNLLGPLDDFSQLSLIVLDEPPRARLALTP